MTRKFEPFEKKRLLVSAFKASDDYQDYKARGLLHSAAHARLVDALYGSMVGLEQEALAAAVEARDWLRAALEGKEDGRAVGGVSGIYHDLGMVTWLIDSRNDVEAFSGMVEKLESSLLEERHDEALDDDEIDFCMPAYLHCREYQKGIALYERFAGPFTGKTSTIKSPRNVAYVLCKSHVDQTYPLEEALAAGQRLLAQEAEGWLARGHALKTAEWLKIVHWNEAKESLGAIETLKMAYDYMPGVKRPKSPQEIEAAKHKN